MRDPEACDRGSGFSETGRQAGIVASAMANPLRFGIVGCGVIAPTHGNVLTKLKAEGLAELVAVADIDKPKAQAFADKHGAKAFGSLEELLQDGGVDAVTICTPSGLHGRMAVQIAQSGRHALSEKPLDVWLDQADMAIEAAKKAGVVYGGIFQERFAPDAMRLKRAIDGGAFGEIVLACAETKWYRSQAYYDSGDWRGTWALDGGGCLMNQGVHYVDMLQWIMGGVRSVQAQVRTAAHKIEVEDVATALVEFRNGAIGVIQGSTSFYPGLAERLEVHGTHGSIIVEGDRVKLWEVDPSAEDGSLYGRGVKAQPTPNVHTHGSSAASAAADPSALWTEQHRLQLEDFTRAVADGRDPFITGEEALEPLKVILAIYRSAKQGGKRVEIAESR